MKALFPRNADEVVSAVEFAKKYGLKISIKNSGHSYSDGASTRAGTLLLNMRKVSLPKIEQVRGLFKVIYFCDKSTKPMLQLASYFVTLTIYLSQKANHVGSRQQEEN